MKTGERSKLKKPENIIRSLLHNGHIKYAEEIYNKLPHDSHLARQGIDTEILRARLMLQAIEFGFAYGYDDAGVAKPLTMEEIAHRIRSDPATVDQMGKWLDLATKIEERAARIRALDAVFTMKDILKMTRSFTQIVLKYVRDPADQKALQSEFSSIQHGIGERVHDAGEALALAGAE